MFTILLNYVLALDNYPTQAQFRTIAVNFVTRLSEMSKEAKLQEMRRNAVALHSSHNEMSSRLKDEDEPLLSGLLNDIVLDHIVPKLPWRAFHILSSVSRPWRQAIKRRLVYDARVRSHSTETLVVLNYTDDYTDDEEDNEISLYSARDDSWHRLPLFPKSRKSQRGIPEYCQCISLDGKIYILGGYVEYADSNDSDDSDDNEPGESSEVYVLDVAGQMEWQHCADMPQPRLGFGSGIVDGKIYVFGGISHGKPIRESVVYDSKENARSSIAPMKQSRAYHHVVTVGEELFVHGGRVYEQDHKMPFLTEVYHAGKDEWRSLGPFGCHKSETLFTAQGELYMLTPHGIYGHDIDSEGSRSWELQHYFSFTEFDMEHPDLEVEAIEAVDDELLALLTWQNSTILHESKGFGSKEGIDLEGRYSVMLEGLTHFMCSLQL